jgi:hypothetical protein
MSLIHFGTNSEFFKHVTSLHTDIPSLPHAAVSFLETAEYIPEADNADFYLMYTRHVLEKLNLESGKTGVQELPFLIILGAATRSKSLLKFVLGVAKKIALAHVQAHMKLIGDPRACIGFLDTTWKYLVRAKKKWEHVLTEILEWWPELVSGVKATIRAPSGTTLSATINLGWYAPSSSPLSLFPSPPSLYFTSSFLIPPFSLLPPSSSFLLHPPPSSSSSFLVIHPPLLPS